MWCGATAEMADFEDRAAVVDSTVVFYQIEAPRLRSFGDFPHKILSLVKGRRGRPAPSAAPPARAARSSGASARALTRSTGSRPVCEHRFDPPFMDDRRRPGLADRLAQEGAFPPVALDQMDASRPDARRSRMATTMPGKPAPLPRSSQRRASGKQRHELGAVGDMPAPDRRQRARRDQVLRRLPLAAAARHRRRAARAVSRETGTMSVERPRAPSRHAALTPPCGRAGA